MHTLVNAKAAFFIHIPARSTDYTSIYLYTYICRYAHTLIHMSVRMFCIFFDRCWLFTERAVVPVRLTEQKLQRKQEQQHTFQKMLHIVTCTCVCATGAVCVRACIYMKSMQTAIASY